MADEPPPPVVATGGSAAVDGAQTGVKGERRAPMALAVLALMVLTVLPPYGVLGLAWIVAALEGVLLVSLVIGDPGRIDDRSRRMRRLSIALVAVLLAVALGATALLVYGLVAGTAGTTNAALLLLQGAKVWLANNIAFALLYWQFDCGGPAERAYGLRPHPDLAFPQELNPDLAPPDWRPRFIDYLYVAFTTANAFSPTDTPPLKPWAKVAMASQALISFVIVGLVIARAINAFA